MARLSPLHLRVQCAIRERQLLRPGQRLLVAFSGGQDSFCLLQILRDLQRRWNWQIFVLHCNHRWSEDETTCACFLQEWLQQQGLPHAIETADPIRWDEAGAKFGATNSWTNGRAPGIARQWLRDTPPVTARRRSCGTCCGAQGQLG